MTLFEPLPYHIELEGKRYRINPYFDVVLDVIDAMGQGWENAVFIDYACYRLIRGKVQDKPKAVQAVLSLMVGESTQKQTQRIVDFSQDAALIYAAFYQAYGIDLIEQRGKLHWKKFVALFGGLPSDTRLSDVMRIRQTPIPAPTKHNRQEIDRLVRLKTAYALKGQNRDGTGLLKMAQSIMNWAKRR